MNGLGIETGVDMAKLIAAGDSSAACWGRPTHPKPRKRSQRAPPPESNALPRRFAPPGVRTTVYAAMAALLFR